MRLAKIARARAPTLRARPSRAPHRRRACAPLARIAETLRGAIFRQNMEKILAHNAGNHSWRAGLNQFTDLTEAEFAARYFGGANEPLDGRLEGAKVFHAPEGFQAPTSISWVAQGA